MPIITCEKLGTWAGAVRVGWVSGVPEERKDNALPPLRRRASNQSSPSSKLCREVFSFKPPVAGAGCGLVRRRNSVRKNLDGGESVYDKDERQPSGMGVISSPKCSIGCCARLAQLTRKVERETQSGRRKIHNLRGEEWTIDSYAICAVPGDSDLKPCALFSVRAGQKARCLIRKLDRAPSELAVRPAAQQLTLCLTFDCSKRGEKGTRMLK